MTIRVQVRNNKQIIVPVRFTRAVNGGPVLDAPDVDDRGFAMGNRPGSWGQSPARGAMVSIQQGDEVRVRLLREDIDAGAPLFITSTDTAIVEVTEPAGGGPLPADGVFKIRGLRDLANRAVSIQVHLGAVDGPVIGDLEPHVFAERTPLRLLVHFVTIDGVSTAQTQAGFRALLTTVNAIWRPAGIQFRNQPRYANEPHFRNENLASGPPGQVYATPGQMTTNLGGGNWSEFSTIINTHPSGSRINVYCVRTANEVLGLTYDNDIARPNGYGVVISDNASAYDLAHELGHFLDLDRHGDEDNAGNSVRSDMWSIRRLMYSVFPPGAPAHRNDVGYGAGQYGALLSVKELPSEQNDNEVHRSRRRARNPY
ncbi:MAG: hypothetical protein IH608_05185 [Proteobacteria bacterium]|nr:hypothetical protein [Pseudomonadota bacterium]